MDPKNTEFYDKLLEEDLLLPHDTDSVKVMILRTQEEHAFFAVNDGRGSCFCAICARVGFPGKSKKRSTQ